MSDEKQVVTLKDWLGGHRDRFMQALPAGSVSLDRFIAAATMEILNNPKLQKCERSSLTASLMLSARFGLEVGAVLGQAWLIPYNESKKLEEGWVKVMTAHFQVGYKGLIVLARRSQTIKTIAAETVYENDFFEVELGLHPNLTHKIDIRKPRGEPIAYYAAVELENGGFQFKLLTKAEAEEHRDRYSRAHSAGEGDDPWSTNFEAMALKTVIIKALKLCPMSVEALEAVGREEREMGMKNVTPSNIDEVPIPPENGEITREGKPLAGATATVARAAAAKAAKPQGATQPPKVAPTPAAKVPDAPKTQEGPKQGGLNLQVVDEEQEEITDLRAKCYKFISFTVPIAERQKYTAQVDRATTAAELVDLYTELTTTYAVF